MNKVYLSESGFISKQKLRKYFLNPIFISIFIWTGCVALFFMRLSRLLVYANNFSSTIITAIMIPIPLAFLSYQIIKINSIAPKKSSYYYDTENIGRAIIILISIFVPLEVFQVVYFHGFPLLWKIDGINRTYMQFGFHGLNGLLYSIQLVLTMYLYFLYLEKNKKRYLFFTFLLLLWATLMLTRFLIIVSLLQLAAIYISTKGINLKKIIIFLVFIFISIILFGLAGDFRTGEKTFYALAQPNQSWPFFLPSGFLWVYMYVTTPFNNLVNTYTYLPASYSYGAQTFGSLIPSFIRKDFITYNSSGKLVTKAFNVSTAYVEPLLDFHIIGVFMYSFLISFTAYFYYRRLIISNRSLFTYAVFYQAIILCIFFNEILYLPVLFQFFLIYITNKIYKFEKRVKL